MRSSSRFSIPAILTAGSIALFSIVAGCGSGGSTTAVAQTGRNQTVLPFIASNDVQYIDAIVPHHEHAIEMAMMELTKGTRADVKAIAQSIKDTQEQEIALLKSARQTLTGQAEIPTPPQDPHMGRDMQIMDQATGAAVDVAFLDNMIPHHAEGISIAHRALPSITRSDVRGNANTVVATQAREIGQMQALR